MIKRLRFSTKGSYRYKAMIGFDIATLCLGGVKNLFAVSKPDIDLAISDKKPRGNNWYAITKGRGDIVWEIAQSELSCISGDSSWTFRLDKWATDVLPDGTLRAYIWMEQ